MPIDAKVQKIIDDIEEEEQSSDANLALVIYDESLNKLLELEKDARKKLEDGAMTLSMKLKSFYNKLVSDEPESYPKVMELIDIKLKEYQNNAEMLKAAAIDLNDQKNSLNKYRMNVMKKEREAYFSSEDAAARRKEYGHKLEFIKKELGRTGLEMKDYYDMRMAEIKLSIKIDNLGVIWAGSKYEQMQRQEQGYSLSKASRTLNNIQLAFTPYLKSIQLYHEHLNEQKKQLDSIPNILKKKMRMEKASRKLQKEMENYSKIYNKITDYINSNTRNLLHAR